MEYDFIAQCFIEQVSAGAEYTEGTGLPSTDERGLLGYTDQRPQHTDCYCKSTTGCLIGMQLACV